jgi:hypothetical protein
MPDVHSKIRLALRLRSGQAPCGLRRLFENSCERSELLLAWVALELSTGYMARPDLKEI